MRGNSLSSQGHFIEAPSALGVLLSGFHLRPPRPLRLRYSGVALGDMCHFLRRLPRLTLFFPIRIFIAEWSVSNCCCNFDASLLRADRMFIVPPTKIYQQIGQAWIFSINEVTVVSSSERNAGATSLLRRSSGSGCEFRACAQVRACGSKEILIEHFRRKRSSGALLSDYAVSQDKGFHFASY